jgi:TonB family protein
LVLDFVDERARGRLREAGLASIIFHLLLFIALLLSPKWMTSRAVRAFTAADLLRERELTYLSLPPDRQSVTKRPNTNVISDKDRVATSRHPTLDRKTLKELVDSARPGSPAPPGPPLPKSPPSPPVAAQATPQMPAQGAPKPPKSDQVARLESPPSVSNAGKGVFSTPMSAGSAIEQAARAAAANRVAGGGGGSAGDYGIGPARGASSVQSNLDILSDTMGVDFGPYLARVLHDVRLNWYNLIPEVARAPMMKRGKVSIEFAILKDGSVAGLRLTGPSGDVSLDRAAWGGITLSNPFPPLPSEFHGQYLALRFHFFYNPDLKDLQ